MEKQIIAYCVRVETVLKYKPVLRQFVKNVS